MHSEFRPGADPGPFNGEVRIAREIAWNGLKDILAAMRAVWNARAPFVSVSRGDKNGIGAFEKRQLPDWLASKEARAAIAGYTVGGEKLFHPEADPKPKS